eukprot:8258067-Alexandrium_andersonii.AAC.1
MGKAKRRLLRRSRRRDLSRVGQTGDNEDAPLLGPAAGGAGDRRDRCGTGKDFATDRSPGRCLEPVNRLGGPVARMPFAGQMPG